MISQTAEYALRAVVHLASTRGEPHTTQQIAAATHVPAPFLSKVLQCLGRAGLVTAQRGQHGGFRLAKPAGEISVLEVVSAVEPVQRIASCPLGLPEHEGTLCPLHARLDRAAAQVEQAFATTTLAEIVGETTTVRPLGCRFPEIAPAAQGSEPRPRGRLKRESS